MDRIVFTLGDTPITLEMLLIAVGSLFALLLAALVVISVRQSARRDAEAEAQRLEAEAAKLKSAELERHLAGLLQAQYEMGARMQTMSEIFGSRTSDLMRAVNERI